MTITFLLLLLCIVSSGFSGNIYKKLSASSGSTVASMTMPALWYGMLAIFFGVFSVAVGEKPDFAAIPVALLGGVCIAAAASILLESMKSVSLSISLIIMNLNFVIPVILSAIFLQIPAKPLQLVGMLISITIIVAINAKTGTTSGTQKVGKMAILLPVFACVANGLVNFCITVNGTRQMPPMFFFAVMYGSGAIGNMAAGCIAHRRNGKGTFPITREGIKKVFPSAMLLGICNGVCFFTEILLADGRMNPAALFTTVTCASIALSLSVGFLFQGDKLTKKSVVSIIFCLIAILCQHSGIS